MSTASSLSHAFAALFGLALGAIVGSFLAVILVRWPRDESALSGRSRCDGCGEALRSWELVPILSYVLLRGRCRRCGGRIDPAHPLIEAAAATIGAAAFIAQPALDGLATASFGWWLLLIGALDARHHWLPDRLSLPLLLAGLSLAALGLGPGLEQRLIGAAAGFLVLWGIAFAYRRVRGREGLGGGDPKLLAALGAWLGWQQLPFVLLGSGLLGLAALLLARTKGRAIAATDRLPLGTLMVVSAWPIWLLIVA